MSDPRRYLADESAAPLARALLGSASRDGLDDAQMATLARALELDVASAATTESPCRRPGLRFSAASTFAAATAVAVAVAAVSVMALRSDGSTSTSASTSASTSTSTSASTSASTSTAAPLTLPPPAEQEPRPADPPAPSDAVSVDQLPEAPKRSVAVHGAQPAASAPAPADDLAAEVRALERVRTAIAEHRIADARAGLATYDATFPKKLLADEARVLHIELLLADGRTAEGEALARTFLATSADSPYAARVRSLVSSTRAP